MAAWGKSWYSYSGRERGGNSEYCLPLTSDADRGGRHWTYWRSGCVVMQWLSFNLFVVHKHVVPRAWRMASVARSMAVTEQQLSPVYFTSTG